MRSKVLLPLQRFGTSEHSNSWFEYDARRDALREVEPFIDERDQLVAASFSDWFTFGDNAGQVPSNCKQSIIVLLTLYPIAMLELPFLNPLTQVPRGGQRPQLPGIHQRATERAFRI